MSPTCGNGKICYVELPAFDVTASADFYANVFGWRLHRRGDGALSFSDTVGEVNGSFVLGRNPMRAVGLLFYIMVDDAAATCDAIVAHGGSIVQSLGMDAPEITARFSDPAGNIIGLYQQPAGADSA